MRTQARSCEPQQADGLTTVQKLVGKAHFTTMFVEKASHVRSAVEFEGLRRIAALASRPRGRARDTVDVMFATIEKSMG